MVTVERAVADGDVAVIDFEGFVDDVAFEGGKGENYSLAIGSHSFIDNFEEQLIGKNAGEDVEVNVTFPEEYQAKELAGKPAVFKVSIKEVKEKQLPEPVSYTHLDVYKRQGADIVRDSPGCCVR